MKALRALLVVLAAIPAATAAAEGGYPLAEANADLSNLASLQRGARNFVNYCQGCHSAKYMRYSQLATDLALTEDDTKANLMFSGTRIYDTMDSVMPPAKARQWFGNAPPDLSLIVRSRGADYVYTFLRSFYADPSRPSGVNNAVLPGTAVVADRDTTLVVSGTGDVIEPEDGVAAIGSGGSFALAAARVLIKHSALDARAIVEEALRTAAGICIYTNDQLVVEELDGSGT